MPFQTEKCNLNNFENLVILGQSQRYYAISVICRNFVIVTVIKVILRQPMLEANIFVESLGPVTVMLEDFCLSFLKKS